MIHSYRQSNHIALPEPMLYIGKRLTTSFLMSQSSCHEVPFLLGPQRQNVGLVPTVHNERKDSMNRDH
uniref:Hypothetical chloroplast RF15 n=1 Tax=Caragana stenophylla TaxID=390502 RepID=A0A895KXN3_9FABA|nr:hypothetical chloroplast RF15 [Caragana stenophylla]QRZ60611.1 hypothetical chloroplast RF15 [Caragana stenophylla]